MNWNTIETREEGIFIVKIHHCPDVEEHDRDLLDPLTLNDLNSGKLQEVCFCVSVLVKIDYNEIALASKILCGVICESPEKWVKEDGRGHLSQMIDRAKSEAELNIGTLWRKLDKHF